MREQIVQKRLRMLTTEALRRSGMRSPELVRRVGTWRKADSRLKRVHEVLHGVCRDRVFIGRVTRALDLPQHDVDAAMAADSRNWRQAAG